MLYPLFRRHVIDGGLIDHGDRIIVGVSGGIDSMVLLDLLCRIRRNLKIGLIAAHVNYGLRGRASDVDEALVREVSERYDIECSIVRKKPPRGKNLQDAARAIRYEFMSWLASRDNASKICTAHNRNDQAETVLLHMIRGAGLKGLRGMSEISLQRDLTIIRPLLFASRNEIEKYVKERKIEYREDASNAKLLYRRNSIRLSLMPQLRSFNPKIEDALAEMAARIGDDDDALDAIAAASFDEAAAGQSASEISLHLDAYAALPAAIRRRILRMAFAKLLGSARDLNSDQLMRMDQIALSRNPRGSYRLPAGCRFSRVQKLISIVRSISIA